MQENFVVNPACAPELDRHRDIFRLPAQETHVGDVRWGVPEAVWKLRQYAAKLASLD